jgi:uncharacterized protein
VINGIMVKYEEVLYGEEIKEIGVLSDTHIPARNRFLPPELFRLFEGLGLILHAGDLVDEKVIDELQVIAPVEAVAGNMDPPNLQRRLGCLKLVKVGGISIALLHGDIGGRRVGFDRLREIFKPAKPQAIVFGHIHEPVNKLHKGILYFNPGSAVDPRRVPRPSCGRLLIEDYRISGEIIYL